MLSFFEIANYNNHGEPNLKGAMNMEQKKFNDTKTFENDLIEILSNLIKDKLNETIQIALETHNIAKIKELISLLSL